MHAEDSADELIDQLRSLPNEVSPEYEDRVRSLISVESSESSSVSLDLQLIRIARDESQDERVRFNAFFCLQTALWRRYEYSEFRDNVQEFERAFMHHGMFAHQQAMYHYSRLDIGSLRNALSFALDATESVPESPGVMNLVAEITAELGEQQPQSLDDFEQAVSRGLNLIDQAIEANRDYAKYYANRARLYALKKHYDKAYRDIRHAIEIEPAGNESVYALRVARYEHIRARIDLHREAVRLATQQETLSAELRDMRSDILQMMGLLAAIVAFVVTGFDIATNYDALEAAAILGVLASVLLVVFGCFGELNRNSPSLKSRTLVIASLTGVLAIVSISILWIAR